MGQWATSPYRSIGIYIGGRNRACSQANLSANWVSTVESQGWRLVPTYVGLQAPCTTASNVSMIDPATASSQGMVAADDAASQANQLGIGVGSAIYFDMESYDNTQASCTNTVLTFMGAWTGELHAKGYVAGEYSSASSGIADQANAVGNSKYTGVDDIWIGAWDNRCDTVYGYTQWVPDSSWNQHRRLHQCKGGHNETWGSATINIDTDYDDGAVAGS